MSTPDTAAVETPAVRVPRFINPQHCAVGVMNEDGSKTYVYPFADYGTKFEDKTLPYVLSGEFYKRQAHPFGPLAAHPEDSFVVSEMEKDRVAEIIRKTTEGAAPAKPAAPAPAVADLASDAAAEKAQDALSENGEGAGSDDESGEGENGEGEEGDDSEGGEGESATGEVAAPAGDAPAAAARATHVQPSKKGGLKGNLNKKK